MTALTGDLNAEGGVKNSAPPPAGEGQLAGGNDLAKNAKSPARKPSSASWLKRLALESAKSSWSFVLRLILTALVLYFLTKAWIGAEMNPWALITDFGNMVSLIGDFLPPNFEKWRLYFDEMIVTVYIGLWGTILAVICAVPMGLMSSENIAPVWLRQPVRRLMDALRSVNEMVFAMLFIVCVGLGPFAGTLALWAHTTGILAKLFSEAVEAIDPQPVEGIRATGANLVTELFYGVIPQVFPLWISFTLYRFESNVRSATVVGMVGGGGIGVILYDDIRGWRYPETCAVMLIIILTVTIIDLLSQKLRKMVI